MADALAHAKRLREIADRWLYDTPSERITVALLKNIEALRTGAKAIEWMHQYQQDTVAFHGDPSGVRTGPKP